MNNTTYKNNDTTLSNHLQDGLPTPPRYWAAMAVAMGIFLAVMDSTVVNVALPTIAQSLNISAASSVWIFNTYNLAILACLLPCSALGERIGLQWVFRIGLTIFMLASLGCIFANSLFELCALKLVQGVGAAAVMSMMGGLTRFIYPSHLFGRGIGINAMIVAVGSMIGPVVCSVILSFANWHWLFFLNVPVSAIALYMTRHLPQTPRQNISFDYIGAALNAMTLCLFVYSLDRLYQSPQRSLVGIVIALVCGAILLHRMKSQPHPLLPTDLFKIERFRFAVLASCFSFAGYMSALVALPFHLQHYFGLTQQQTGYMLIVWPIGSGSMALLAARLSERYSASVLAGAGATVMSLAMLILACLPASAPIPLLVLLITLIGIGFGFFQMPNNKAMLSSAPKNRSGAAGGVQATSRVFSQSIGAALVALTLALPINTPTTLALWGGSLCALIAVLVNIKRFLAHS